VGLRVQVVESPEGEARARAWSRYWRSGVRHSCIGSFDDHYGAGTQGFWRERFASIGAQDRVLELGCGNGSLIRFLNRVGGQWPASINAVDLADLDAGWLGELEPDRKGRVHLHPRTLASALPLADASVTQIFSQYALEYFADDDTWRELDRVMAPRATVALIAHHRDSHVCRLAQAERADADWLLCVDGPLDCAAALLPWLAMSTDPGARAQRAADPLASLAKQAFNARFAELGERIAAAEFPDLLRDTAEGVMGILQRVARGMRGSAADELHALRAGLTDNRLRVGELVDCALDRDGIEDWCRRLHKLGFTQTTVDEIREQHYLFGWSLVASR
jgi:SAM-dependent methyltransferase